MGEQMETDAPTTNEVSLIKEETKQETDRNTSSETSGVPASMDIEGSTSKTEKTADPNPTNAKNTNQAKRKQNPKKKGHTKPTEITTETTKTTKSTKQTRQRRKETTRETIIGATKAFKRRILQKESITHLEPNRKRDQVHQVTRIPSPITRSSKENL